MGVFIRAIRLNNRYDVWHDGMDMLRIKNMDDYKPWRKDKTFESGYWTYEDTKPKSPFLDATYSRWHEWITGSFEKLEEKLGIYAFEMFHQYMGIEGAFDWKAAQFILEELEIGNKVAKDVFDEDELYYYNTLMEILRVCVRNYGIVLFT